MTRAEKGFQGIIGMVERPMIGSTWMRGSEGTAYGRDRGNGAQGSSELLACKAVLAGHKLIGLHAGELGDPASYRKTMSL